MVAWNEHFVKTYFSPTFPKCVSPTKYLLLSSRLRPVFTDTYIEMVIGAKISACLKFLIINASLIIASFWNVNKFETGS